MSFTQKRHLCPTLLVILLATMNIKCAPSIDNPDGGCYLINDGHKCDCELNTDECGAVLGIWTERCECTEETTCDSTDPFTHTDNDDDSITTTVNASCEENWVYLNLDETSEVVPKAPEDNEDWDLAFQRFKIKSNGGISGSQDVRVAVVSDTDFEDLIEAPQTGYLSDAEDSDDEDEDPDFTFLAPEPWYNYNEETHILTPKDHIYVVQSTSGEYFKIQITDYYDDAGTSGYLKFIWDTLLAPSE